MFQAFMGPAASYLELKESNLKLESVCSSQQKIYNRQLALNFATSSFDYLVRSIDFSSQSY